MMLASLFVFFMITLLVTCDDKAPPVSEDIDYSQLKIEYLHKPECERRTKKHDVIYVHYTGFLEDGTQFDTRYETLYYMSGMILYYIPGMRLSNLITRLIFRDLSDIFPSPSKVNKYKYISMRYTGHAKEPSDTIKIARQDPGSI